jgi:hypothetical protein
MAEKKRSDFQLLKGLQQELIDTLQLRKDSTCVNNKCCKARIRRLRLEIQELMLRIEQGCDTWWYHKDDTWE